MFDSVLKIIRSKTRQEWIEALHRLVLLTRDTLKANGELSALIGLVLGILLVLLFRWVLFFGVLIGLIIWVVLMIAKDE